MNKIYSIDDLMKILHPIVISYGVHKVVLYGSYARGEAHEQSDVDLYVVAGNMSLLNASAMGYDIRETLKKQASVTFEELMEIPKEFHDEIKKDGIVLYEKKWTH